MPDTLKPEHLQQLARLGAAARLKEIEAELAAIRTAFPDLTVPAPAAGPRQGRARPTRRGKVATQASVPAGRTSRRRMPKSARKAVSERMKRYWASRREAKAAAAASGEAQQAESTPEQKAKAPRPKGARRGRRRTAKR